MPQWQPEALLRALTAGSHALVDGAGPVPVLDGGALTGDSWSCTFDGAGVFPSRLGLRTSGTTGAPTTWIRQRASLCAEADLLITRLGLDSAGAVVSFAPPGHLYGLVAGLVLAARLGVPSTYLSLGRPDPPRSLPAHTVVTALPAALGHLHRLLSIPPGGRVTVLHSTAQLPGTWWASPLAADPTVACHELLGSTESGLVATRPASPGEEPWQLVDDVAFSATVRTSEEVPLAVTSPRLARAPGGVQPQEYTLDDVVVVDGPRSFRRLGRHTRVVKVNGYRVHLDRVERELSAHTQLEFTCRPVPDPVRGEWYVLDVAGDASAARTLADLCRDILPANGQPRTVRPVPSLARTITGKPKTYTIANGQ